MTEHRQPLPTLDGAAGPALPITRQRAEDLVDAALAEAGAPAPRLSRRFTWLAAAMLFTIAGTGAALGSYLASGTSPSVPEPADRTNAAEPTAPANEEPAPDPVQPREQLAPTDIEVNQDEANQDLEPEPVVDARPDVRRLTRPLSRRARPEASPAPAEDLLRTANALRAERRWRSAAETYARVVEADPNGGASYSARVALAGLYVEHLRRPTEALALYRAALRQRPTGALAEEARYGMAEAARATGNPRAEASALESYLRAHPTGAMAARARARLGELGVSP
jgi:tetratricopeptide (TPR) repeat protein